MTLRNARRGVELLDLLELCKGWVREVSELDVVYGL